MFRQASITKLLALRPQLFSTLKSYNRKTFMADLMSGIIVGIVALPLSIAFGIASGVTPEKGIITAIVAGLIVSVFWGSKVQIGGLTEAFIVIIYGAYSRATSNTLSSRLAWRCMKSTVLTSSEPETGLRRSWHRSVTDRK